MWNYDNNTTISNFGRGYIMTTFLKKQARYLGMGLLLASTLSLTACEMPAFVSDVQVKSFEETGHVFGEVSTTVNFQGMVLPQLDFPIKNPSDQTSVIGAFKSVQTPGNPSVSIVTITLDLTKVAAISTSGPALLPNGAIVPVTGYAPEDVLEFDSVANVKVYFSLDTANRQAMIGAAIPVEQLDWVGSSMGEANLFHGFNFSNVTGVAGAFTSAVNGQSGLGLFIDISTLMGSAQVQQALANNALEQNRTGRRAASELGAAPNSLTDSARSTIENELIQLSNDGVQLSVR